MSRKFKKVERYECSYCGHLFKTERHDCKFDPEKKNCLTCVHCQGQERSHGSEEDGGYGPPMFKCEAGLDGGTTSIDVIQNQNWNMQCEKWRMLERVYTNARTAYGKHLLEVLDAERNRNDKTETYI